MQKTPSPRGGGRPRKFAEPSTRITITLPKSTLKDLAAIHGDRAQAIVRATRAAMGGVPGRTKPVEVVEMIPGSGLIVVGPCAALSRIPWLNMIEIAPARYLLTVPSGTAVEVLEVAIRDAIEQLPGSEQREKGMLETLKDLLVGMRRASTVSKAELLIVKT
jgi:hypothetical protein